MPDVKRFYDDPALTVLDTRVIDAGTLESRPWVRLEETIFYPEGGGQPADRGTIGDIAVLDVQSRGEEVLHFLERPLGEGPVRAVLDAERRFDHRQQHTAQHLLTAILLDRHARRTVAFHLGDTYTSIDIDGDLPSAATLERWERDVNAAIREDRTVTTRWVEPADMAELAVRSRGLPEGHGGAVRLVEIAGIDLNTCGGTHVARLAEIQALHITGVETMRGGTRVKFVAGGRVFQRLHEAAALDEALKARFGTAPEEFPAIADAWQQERRRLERRVTALEAALAESIATELVREAGPVVARFVPGANPELLRAIAQSTVQLRPDATVVVVGDDAATHEAAFIVQAGADGPADVSDVGVRVRDALGARGGGKGKVFQGRGGKFSGDLTSLR